MASTQAYDMLTDFFRKHEGHEVQIEMVPPVLEPTDGLILQDGNCIGIPKKVLVQAFITARTIFFQSKGLQNPEPALEATRIILLFDPEHLTAANFRKRRLLDIQTRSLDGPSKELSSTTWRELGFLNDILTSPLHRQSKSPTLWYHRYWLISTFFLTGSAAPLDAVLSAILDPEMGAVFKAGEQHPKNYYAWEYARRLISSLQHRARIQDKTHVFSYAVESIVAKVHKWCFGHLRDTSGWSFLLYLIQSPVSREIVEKVVEDTLRYLVILEQQHEGIWMFLRTILADTILHDKREEFILRIQSYSEMQRQNDDKESGSLTPVEKAINWIERNKKPLLQS